MEHLSSLIDRQRHCLHLYEMSYTLATSPMYPSEERTYFSLTNMERFSSPIAGLVYFGHKVDGMVNRHHVARQHAPVTRSMSAGHQADTRELRAQFNRVLELGKLADCKEAMAAQSEVLALLRTRQVPLTRVDACMTPAVHAPRYTTLPSASIPPFDPMRQLANTPPAITPSRNEESARITDSKVRKAAALCEGVGSQYGPWLGVEETGAFDMLAKDIDLKLEGLEAGAADYASSPELLLVMGHVASVTKTRASAWAAAKAWWGEMQDAALSIPL